MGIAPLLLSDDLDLFHDNRRAGLVVPVGAHSGDLVHDIHAGHDLAKGGILAVQVGCVLVHDEELAAGAVGFMARAMLITPRVCLSGLFTPFAANSPLMFQPGPPVPLPSGQPPWIIKPGITRWKVRPL